MGLEHADFMLLFDQWAGTYDQTVYRTDPVDGFEGYQAVLDQVAAWSEAAPGRRVLDVGTGTGNLAAPPGSESGYGRLKLCLPQFDGRAEGMRRPGDAASTPT